MESVFNDPLISKFFQTISLQDREETLRELVLLGISVVNTKITRRSLGKQNQPSYECKDEIDLVAEIEQMKQKIQKLSLMVAQKSPQSNLLQKSANIITFKENNPFERQREIKITHQQQSIVPEKTKVTPKVTQTVPFLENECEQRGRGISRHHLDDTEVRKVLVNPYANQSPKQKKMKKKEKAFEHQQQIDKEELRMRKTVCIDREDVPLSRSKHSRVSNKPQFHAESKIKSLIEKDRMKYKQATTGFDFQKYEYSDEEDYYESTNQLQEEEPQKYSNYLSQSSQIQDISLNPSRKPQKEVQSDAISESSSFSKFSMGSQRQAGKISLRKKN